MPDTVKAVVMTAPGKIEIQKLPYPKLERGALILKMRMSGICGTDKHAYKGEKVKVQVWDRLPHAENETVGVSLVKATPELSKDPLYVRDEKSKNLLRWDVKVDPKQNGEKALAIEYEYKMELDKNVTIGAFLAK